MRGYERVTKLSRREIECLKWAASDKTVKETSRILNISPDTVKYHRTNALNKTGTHTITGAVGIAMMNGLVL